MDKKPKVETFDLGDSVVCDLCNADFTKSDRTGGFQFESKAICPDCAPSMMKTIVEYGEQEYIRATCGADQSFADFVRDDLREGKPGVVTITSW